MKKYYNYKLFVEKIRSYILGVGAYVPVEGSKGVEAKFTRTDGIAFNKQLAYLVKQGNIAGSDGIYWTI